MRKDDHGIKKKQEESSRLESAAGLSPLVALFALHTFLLMGTGTWSDSVVVGEGFGATFYFVRESVLAAGFLLYAVFAQWRKSHPLPPRVADAMNRAAVVLFVGCILGQLFGQPGVRMMSALGVSLLIGVVGALAYDRVALAAVHVAAQRGSEGARHEASPVEFRRSVGKGTWHELGLVVGAGGSIAVVVQYLLQIAFPVGWWLTIVFVICFGLLLWIARMERPAISAVQELKSDEGSTVPCAEDACAADQSVKEPCSKVSCAKSSGSEVSRAKNDLGVVPLACVTAATICLFVLPAFYEAAIRSAEAVSSFYEWHRLCIAISYIVIGGLAFARGRTGASLAVVVVALFSVVMLMQAAMVESGPLTTVLFYALLGATLAWSIIAFMSAAGQSEHSALVACIPRVLSALVTAASGLIVSFGDLPVMGVVTGALVLLAVIIIAMVRGGFLVFAENAVEGDVTLQQQDASSLEERMRQLVDECDLTDREQEVLAELVLTEDKNQVIADNLGISRRQLQTHISSIYEKTGATTRAGLVMLVNEATLDQGASSSIVTAV